MTQRPITVILNSGRTRQKREQLGKEIADTFKQAGVEAYIVTTRKGKKCMKECASHVQEAAKTGESVIAAGGDGTVNGVAQLCLQHGVTFGIIPLGTFNYCARELGIPTDIQGAVSVIARGMRRRIAVGVLRDRIFLNNASFGVYSKLIRHREAASSSFGRWRIIAALTAAYTLLTKQKSFSMQVSSSDRPKQSYRTSMVFVGNNTFQLENLGLEAAKCTRQDKLAMIVVKKNTRWETVRFLLRGVMGNLKDESKLEELCSEDFEVEINRAFVNVVIDGEIIRCPTPLRFAVAKEALEVIAPPESGGAA